MTLDTDVLVCGAGPVGLVLAIDLARRGIAVRLVEKLHAPFAGSKGKGLQPRTQEILEQLGLLEDFKAVAGLYPPFRIYGPEGTKEEPYALPIEPTAAAPYPNIMLVPQSTTEAILRRRAKDLGVGVEWGSELIGFVDHDDGVAATIATPAGETRVTARYLVGTDGGQSTVRRLAGIRLDGETVPMRAIFADVRIDGLSTDVWHRWPDAPGGQLLLCPLLGSNLFQLTAQVAVDGDIDLSRDGIAALIHERAAPFDIRIGDMPWRSLMRVNFRLADRYREGRVFLAGDAAHVHPPTGAQGLNTGVQDAFNLGWKLHAVLNGAAPMLLDSYESERRPVADAMLALAGKLFNAWQGDRKVERGTLTDQLGITYRHSPLSRGLVTDSPFLQPGDRAADAVLHDRHGRSCRLFDLLRHPGFTLLAHGGEIDGLEELDLGGGDKVYRVDVSEPELAGDSDLSDNDGALRDIYGLSKGGWVLIRPDGYIARTCANALSA